VVITVGFGAPRPTAVRAVLGYRIVNYWLALMPGTIAYLRLRLSPGPPAGANDQHRQPGDEKAAAICLLAADVSQWQRSRFY
jgi:hypothetical protein